MNLRDRFTVIQGLPTKGVAERAVLLASLMWVNQDGELWPGIESWAALSGMTVAGFCRVLKRLVENGIVERVLPSRGGFGCTTRYRIPALANPDSQSGFTPEQPQPQTLSRRPATLTQGAPNPDPQSPKPCPTVKETTKNKRENHQQSAVAVDDVFARFRIEHLRNHPNATPERLAYIEAAAPTKDYPDRFAAACIRDGYDVPPKFQAVAKKERDRVEREASIERFNRMTPNEQQDVLNQVWVRFAGLRGKDAQAPGMAGAIHQVLQSSASIAAGIEPKGTTTPARSAQELR